MTDKKSSHQSSSRPWSRWLRVVGVSVLLLGVASEGVVCWLDMRSTDLMDAPEMMGYDRAERRQMGLLFGRQGAMIENLMDALKKPGTQATMIIVVTVLVAGGCFYLAGLHDHDEKPPG
jgi:hypothetical protein